MPAAAVVVYSTVYCPFCHMAKRLLTSKQVEFTDISVEARPDLRDWLREVSRQHTVPQIFINGTPVGGYTDLAELERQGRLDELLALPPAADNPVIRL